MLMCDAGIYTNDHYWVLCYFIILYNKDGFLCFLTSLQPIAFKIQLVQLLCIYHCLMLVALSGNASFLVYSEKEEIVAAVYTFFVSEWLDLDDLTFWLWLLVVFGQWSTLWVVTWECHIVKCILLECLVAMYLLKLHQVTDSKQEHRLEKSNPY